MRKHTLIFLAVLTFGTVWADQLSAQPSEEDMRQMQLVQNVMEGIMPGPQMLNRGPDRDKERERFGITEKQMQELNEKMMKAFEPLEKELREKFGSGPGDISPDQLDDVAETMTGMMTKVNDISRKVVGETFSRETIEKLDKASFQRYGGTFGGALNVQNLASLNLTDEQKVKAEQIIEKLNRERFKLIFSMEVGRKPGEEPDFKELMEKVISLTRRGQREIEALLTPEQKKQAEQLMADLPEEYRLLNDYLANRPWRLDESNWKPGDGPPPTMENYPGETRPERPRGERVFPGS